jgi:hypothetical protein
MSVNARRQAHARHGLFLIGNWFFDAARFIAFALGSFNPSIRRRNRMASDFVSNAEGALENLMIGQKCSGVSLKKVGQIQEQSLGSA